MDAPRQATRPQRLFFALDPAARDRGRLADEVARYRASLPAADVRWLDPAKWHLTLRFLGRTDRGEALRARLEDLALSGKPALRVRALGPFPRRRPVVVAAHLSGHEGVEALASALEAAARDCGFPAEERPFRPHLTVARLRRGQRAHLKSRTLHFALRFECLSLYRSDLSPSGARYTALHRWPFDSETT